MVTAGRGLHREIRADLAAALEQAIDELEELQ
jgi:hypothetical protein